MDDKIKISLIAFNIAVIVFALLLFVALGPKGWGWWAVIWRFFLTLIFGGAAGGGAYYVQTKVLK
jgi:hypothetical protein